MAIVTGGVGRTTYQVRITNPNDKQMSIDVEVLVAVTLLGEGGNNERVYEFGTTAGGYFINDYTGDFDAFAGTGAGGTVGSLNEGTDRVSHIERVTNQSDPTQFFDVEVLDAFMVGEASSNTQQFYWLNAIDYGITVDIGSVGFNSNPPPSTTGRGGHTVKIQQTNGQVTDDDDVPTFCSNSDDPKTKDAPGDPTKFTAIIKTDAISWLKTNSSEHSVNFHTTATAGEKNDITQWTVDDQGQKCPPENTDPNPYIVWPDASKGATAPAGPWVGAMPTHTPGPDGMEPGPIMQGPLWWIKRINQPSGLWYWYLKKDQPLEWTYSWLDGDLHYLPLFARIVDGYHPEFGNPIPIQGYDGPSFSNAAGNESNDGVNLGGTDPGTGQKITGNTALENAILGIGAGGLMGIAPDTQDYFNQDVPGHAGGLIGMDTWGVYGLLGGAGNNTMFGSPMTSPPKTMRRQFGVTGGLYMDIWNLTGLADKRPGLTDPKKAWDQINNPYMAPSAALAKECALTFQKMWNKTSQSLDTILQQTDGHPPGTVNANPGSIAWQFAGQGLIDTYAGLNNAGSFNAGLNMSVFHFPAVTITFANCDYIGVDQLDEQKWDTTVFPPVLRSSEPKPKG